MSESGASNPKADQTKGAAKFPLFYKKPVPLQSKTHAQTILSKKADFAFAANSTAVPIIAREVPIAAQNYPIVFTGGESPQPFAVLGLGPNQNLFVNPDGTWREKCYIPAYVRRYPFILITSENAQRVLLSIDEDCSRIGTDETVDGNPLFDAEGKPTPTTDTATKFCQDFHQNYKSTAVFGAAVAASGILRPNQLNIRNGDKQSTALQGFQIVDEKALRALPDETILDWHKKGWLSLLNMHLASQYHWNSLRSISGLAVDKETEADVSGAVH
ncbi:MAG: SapC family protein [Parvibaculaceae bacterium]|nr:SapC family protein [Parvibaculaceae bacterium]